MTSRAFTEVKGSAEVKWLETSCLSRAQTGVMLPCTSQLGWLHFHRTAEGMALIVPTISQHSLRVQNCFGARDTSVIWIQACTVCKNTVGSKRQVFMYRHPYACTHMLPGQKSLDVFCPSAPLDCHPFQAQDLHCRLWHKTRNKITSLKGIFPLCSLLSCHLHASCPCNITVRIRQNPTISLPWTGKYFQLYCAFLPSSWLDLILQGKSWNNYVILHVQQAFSGHFWSFTGS